MGPQKLQQWDVGSSVSLHNFSNIQLLFFDNPQNESWTLSNVMIGRFQCSSYKVATTSNPLFTLENIGYKVI